MPIATNPSTGEVVYLDDAGAWQPAKVAENPQTKERLAWDGRSWVGVKKPEPPVTIRALAEQAREGIPILGPLAGKAGAAIDAASVGLTHALGGTASGGMSDAPDFSTRYAQNLARQNEESEKFREAHPVKSTVAGLAGGAAALAPIGMTATGAKLLGIGGDTVLGMAARGALSGGAIGGADAASRGEDIAKGAVIGGALGGGAPIAARAIGTALSPIVSNIAARVAPERYAGSQLARAIGESGQTPQQIADAVAQAAAEGQPMFTVADALGNAGQRQLAAVARAPGEGRTAVVDFLEQRQAGQGRRVANQLAEGFDAPQTASATEARLTAQRSADAAANYGAVRGGALPVDVTPAIQTIDRFLQPGATGVLHPGTAIADDSIEALLRRARGMLTDGRSQVTDFNAAFRVKREFDNMIERGTPSMQRELIPVRNALDDALARSAPAYANARNTFRQQSQAIDAIAEGRTAATRGRTENTIPAFQAMRPDQQAAFRAGYVDPLIERAQGGAVGVNAARPLTSSAFADEAAAMAPGAERMGRQIGRENQMFETRRQATGGSQTADNLADAAALGEAPAIAQQLLSGNVGGAIKTSLQAIVRHASGSTPAVRAELAQLLTMRGGTVTAPELQRLLNEATQRVREARTRALLAATVAARDAQPALSR